MANYHATFHIIKRSSGKSAVGSSAYINAEKLNSRHTGMTFDYTRKNDVTFSAILAPENAPKEFLDREKLWNAVERIEKRKDAQLARSMEVSLPIELNHAEHVRLITEFVQSNFVKEGMIADVAIHSQKNNPHAHILLTMRDLTPDGFGQKNRSWNRTGRVLKWRENWAEIQNRYLAEIGKDIHLDPRSYADQGIDITPQIHLGSAHAMMRKDPERAGTLERVQEFQRIARENGERIIGNPRIALEHLSHHEAVFTEKDILKYAHRYSADPMQYENVRDAIELSPELVRLGKNDKGESCFTTETMLKAENRMLENVEALSELKGHGVRTSFRKQAKRTRSLTPDQESAFDHILEGGDVVAVTGYAGSGKSYTLSAVREAYEADGYRVQGVALAGIAAQGLETGSGISSRTIHRKLFAWEKGRETLTGKDVLVVDEAGMVGTRQLHQLIGHVKESGAKLILVGDDQQLQPIEAGGAFRGIVSRIGCGKISEIRRQNVPWQKEATRLLSGGSAEIEKAIDLYIGHNSVFPSDSPEDARSGLIDAWKNTEGERLILAFRNRDVAELNQRARRVLQEKGVITEGRPFETEKGERFFSEGDRVMFLRNDRSMGVKNGSLGTIEGMKGDTLAVRIDERLIAVDTLQYRSIDHGYASTVHKAQGATVDHTFVLATSHFDKHLTYVAMSRHRESARIFMSHDPEGFNSVCHMKEQMSRKAPKRLASDFSSARGIDISEPEEKMLSPLEIASVIEKYEKLSRERDLLADIHKEKTPFMLRVEDYRNGITCQDLREELQRFKTEINLSEFAASMGYEISPRESYKNMVVMRNGSDKINITRDSDGHYVYFNWHKGKGGSIVDFIQDQRPDMSLGEVRRVLRPWIGSEYSKPSISNYQQTIEPVQKDRQELLKTYGELKSSDSHPYLYRRNIHEKVLEDQRFEECIFTDSRRNVIFPHANLDGACGFEIRNKNFKGFSKGGEKGLWVSRAYKGDTRLVITESPIDALSYHQLYPNDKTRYISFSGKMSETQHDLIQRTILKMPEGSAIIFATDNDREGNRYVREIMQRMDETKTDGYQIMRHTPKYGKDFNETLKHLQESLSAEKKKDRYEIEILREKPFPRRYHKTVEVDSTLSGKETQALLDEAASEFVVRLGFETRKDVRARVYPAREKTAEKSKEKTRDSGFEM